ncbi:hypothetical protein LWI28_025872 [Acer negundo]|uniref:DUF7865 domain-containing protein n=1 Tax=Acer negundo TaxID=4023 RepID=A0AAD5P5Z1_ACENE|nr:hypothetical protein LWI28_025872 [Acer negundo]
MTPPSSPSSSSLLLSPSSPSSSAAFFVICILHSLIALTSGFLMMFRINEIYSLTHGSETAAKMVASNPHDQLLIETSDSFAGLLLFAIGFLIFMVSFVRDKAFQLFFAKGCTVLHIFMAMWRVYFERRVEDLSWDLLRKTVGDFLLALSWVFFLVYSWREKYD